MPSVVVILGSDHASRSDRSEVFTEPSSRLYAARRGCPARSPSVEQQIFVHAVELRL
jgi:hypothetical protein